MSRFVFDTNTLISGLLLPRSTPGQAVRRGLRDGVLLVSDDTLAELAAVLARPKFDAYVSLADRQEFFRQLGHVAIRVPITYRLQACRDPKDDKFLELAVNGEASHLITGDRDLLVLQPFRGVKILAAAAFVGEK